MVVFFKMGAGGLFKPFRDGRAWTVRADSVFDSLVGVPVLRLGFSGLGVRERGRCVLEGDAIFERKPPFNPTFEGVLIIVPRVRPRMGVASGDCICDGKVLFVKVP